MKTLKEKFAICMRCKNRKFSSEKGTFCSLTGEKPEFEDECPSFEGDGDNAENEREVSSVPDVYTSDWLKKNTEIRGWLSFFLVMLVFGGVISLIYNIGRFYKF